MHAMAGEKRERGKSILVAAAAASVTVLALAGTALAQAAAPGAAGAAGAAGGAAQQGAPQWIKLCSPDATTKKNLCLVQQEIYADTGQFIASATFRMTQDDPKMQFIIGVPPGMLIQPGIQVQIDMGKQMPLMYSICFPNTCFADLDINADFVKTVRGGKQLTISAVNQGAQSISFPISLAGFTKAYDGAGVDPNTPTGQAALDALSASLKAHADEARQRLIDQQQALPR
jgi:invasion protein IalB